LTLKPRLVPPSLLSLLAVSIFLSTSSCQELDPNLTRGSAAPAGNSGDAGANLQLPESCDTTRMRARAVLASNCAGCHQSPGNPAVYQGTFVFILDLPKLTTGAPSPSSPVGAPRYYVVKGDPSQSFIYQRLASNPASMPPASRTQRPTAADVQVLSQWITNCIGDPTSPGGWPSPEASTPAAGDTSYFETQ
jgi:hypothetical protein